jgi:glycosyltransferase involved in cell wall biosynthesis
VVLHDAVLQHFFLGWLDEQSYVAEFAHNYGEWSRALARQMWRGRASSLSARYFEYPMLRRIAERSRAVVVHNAGAAAMVKRHAPQAAVVEIPLLYRPIPEPAAAEVIRFRQSCRISPGAFLFAVLGYLRESKRLLAVLRVFERLRPRAVLLIAGGFLSTDLERAAAPLLAQLGVVRLPHLDERRFALAARACDACVNLRYPGAGESSDITVQLMGAARAVLLSDSPENAAFPDDACVRVETLLRERESLYEHMVLLTSFPGLAREIGQRAAAHIASRHALDRVAGLYWSVLCRAVG